MRNKSVTEQFYIHKLGFIKIGNQDFKDYLILEKDHLQIHFFEFSTLNPKENYGQVYIRTEQIDVLYSNYINKKVEIHPNGKIEDKAWGQREFSLLDPDYNLLTYGQTIEFN